MKQQKRESNPNLKVLCGFRLITKQVMVDPRIWNEFLEIKPKDKSASEVVRGLIFDFCEQEFRKKIRGENIDGIKYNQSH